MAVVARARWSPMAPPKSVASVREYTVEMTPALAEQWLDMVPEGQRHVRDSHVKKLAQSMASGQWRPEVCPPLLRDNDGWVWDGQHRLWAVLVSGVTVPFAVRDGVPLDAVVHVDTGAPRGLSDVLKMQANVVAGARRVGAVTKLVYAWDVVGARGQSLFAGWASAGVTHQQVLEFFLDHDEELQDACRQGRNVARALTGAPGPAGLAWCLFNRIDIFLASQMAKDIADPSMLPDGHPVLAMRKLILLSRQSTNAKGFPGWVQLAYLIKTWNALRREPVPFVKQMVFRPGSNEAFPEPK